MEETLNENQKNTQTNQVLSKLSIEFLKESAPWMTFVSIVGFILCGFIAIAAFIILATMSGSNQGEYGIITFFVYILLAAVLLVSQIFLFTWAREIKKFCKSFDNEALENAFEMQKRFWKFTGILIIVYLSLIIVSLVVALATAM
jgi:hypothetical protein